jgi:hypothetical protein
MIELAGLTLGQVLTVFTVTGVVVVGLYLLKLRRRVVVVPFVRLWDRVLADSRTTRLFSQFKRWLSLLLALLLVALLAAALGDPRRPGARDEGRSLVLLLDASASMQATDVAPSRLDRAKLEARRVVDGLGPNDRALVARMEARTTPLSPMTDDAAALRAAIDAVTPTEVAASFPRGLRFAIDALRGQPHPEIVVLSDGHLGEARDDEGEVALGGLPLRFVPIGRGRRNVGITAFSVRRYPLDKSRSAGLVELRNAGPRDESVELTLIGDGRPLDVQTIDVPAGGKILRTFEDLAGADSTLEARITLADGKRDELPADDRAYARLPDRRRARVLCVTRGNLYLQAALLLDEYLDVTETPPEAYPPQGRFDVVIFDDFVPASPPDAHAIYLHPRPAPGRDGPLVVTGTIERPLFEQLDRRHPLLRFTALRDVNVGEALAVTLAPGDERVAADPRGPLIVAGTRAGHRFVALTFDVRRSDLPLRVAWPLLLLNAIDGFLEEDAGYLSSHRTGETWRIPVPAETVSARVMAPDGDARDVPIVEGRAVVAGLRAGFHRLVTRTASDSAQTQTLAANLADDAELDITPVPELRVGATKATKPQPGRPGLRSEPWTWLVLAALALLCVEWFTYHRRLTV